MSLSNGNYLIRSIPANVSWPFVGGNYATRNEINSPIIAQPKISTDDSPQVWRVETVSSNSNTYKITQPINPNIHIGPVIGGFGIDASTNNVILSTTILDWVLTLVNATENSYIIQSQDHEIGSINAVTVENSNLVVQQIGIGDNKGPLPQWQFISQDNLD
ncbi:hypothetical protein JR316_0007638 [Psilocybe cubensis]|uniref:Uncharacterized protein n=2 Tax=Psilocybe cubensis TaxID=181762 RepID=A0ACB8GTS0_PSICU|nr:hypothetical protein JR316_0007638 [Psilocybe cubensis]KAH9479061.1 hypothetical protein JR316_0007638 [Psilocybe cubensis]